MSGVNRLVDDKNAVFTLIAKNQQRLRGIIGELIEVETSFQYAIT